MKMVAVLALLLASLSFDAGFALAQDKQDPPAKDPPLDPAIQKVCDMVRSRTTALVSAATGSKVKFEEAVALAAKLEETIVEESAKKLGLTADEVKDAWKKRDRKPRKIAYGDGSWIPSGGQDGGLDSQVKGTPVPDSTDLVGGGPSILTRRKPPPPGEPVPMGKPLKTREEWWATATTGERAAFVEGEFVRKASFVEKKEESKKCATCNGKGTLNVKRGGLGLTILCNRCHGTKEDLIVVYE
jgi:hypothetical protein